MANEAFARVKIDQLLKDADWSLSDGRSVRFEYPLDDGGKADYALFDRQSRALAVLEAKSTSVNLSAGEAQGGRYADQLGVPFIFLSNGEEVWFRDKTQGAHLRRVETVFSQDDLARRKAASEIRRDPLSACPRRSSPRLSCRPYLANGGALDHAQEMAAHESPRTTKLYDRTKERLTQDEVERIRL